MSTILRSLRRRRLLPVLAAAVLVSLGCESEYKASGGDPQAAKELRKAHETEAQQAITLFKAEDPSMDKFFKNSYAYVVFPSIAKGGAGLGGAHGRGVVYEQGKSVGMAGVSQGTIGFQLGGQVYREIIFFKDRTAFDNFKASRADFAAQASAVAVKSGASADADFQGGIAVLTMPIKGLMGEASVGGQKFSYEPWK